MTSDKAIKTLRFMGTPKFKGHTEHILAARQLGIEALKRLKGYRDHTVSITLELLPGETKE